MRDKRLGAIALSAALMFTTEGAAAQLYTFEILRVPEGNGQGVALGINNDGRIVIFSVPSQNSYLRSPQGAFEEISFPGRLATAASGISNAGVVVGGVYDDTTQTYLGFTRSTDGDYSAFRYPKVTGIDQGYGASDINVNGVIVGNGMSAGGFVRSVDGTFDVFQFQGMPFTTAAGINDDGLISGNATDFSDFTHFSFLRSPAGAFTPIAYPGATSTDARKLNNLGQVVGRWWYQLDLGIHGFLREPDGSFVQVDFPGALRTELFDINDAGQIVGAINDDQGRWSAFLATPIVPSDTPVAGSDGLRLTVGASTTTLVVNYALPAAHSALLSVYDARGRAVYRTPVPGGAQTYEWRPNSLDGPRSGVYFVELKTPRSRQTAKWVRAR